MLNCIRYDRFTGFVNFSQVSTSNSVHPNLFPCPSSLILSIAPLKKQASRRLSFHPHNKIVRANVGTVRELCLAHHELEVVLFDLSGAYLLRKGVLRQIDIGVEPLGV
jgi:hypothetical protein